MKKIILLLSMGLVLASCGKKTESTEEQETPKAGYKLNLDDAAFQWEAFKFTERKGVKGTFDSIAFTPAVESGSMEEIINDLAFEIFVESTNSGDATRDPKIIDHFFGSMINSSSITGKLSSFEMINEVEGALYADITMNDRTVKVPCNIKVMDAIVQLTTNINIENWEAKASVDSLNSVCEALHTGEDGVSKLWSEVSITVNMTRSETEAN